MNLRILTLLIVIIVLSVKAEASPDVHKLLEERLSRLASAPDDKVAIRDAANAYRLNGDYDNAGICAEKLLKIAEETGDREFAGLNGSSIMAPVMMTRGNGEEAYRMLEYARVIANGINDHKALAQIHNGFALYYSTLASDDYTAISHCYQGIEEAKLANDDYRASILLSNLAELYNDHYDTEGLTYARQAYELAEKLGDTVTLFYSSLTLADALMIQGNIAEAGEILIKNRDYASELGYERTVENVIVNALHQYHSGNTKTAIELCEHAFNCDFLDPSRAVVMRVYLIYADILNKSGKPEKALEIAREGLDYAKGFNITSYVGELMKEMSESHRQMGDYVDALDYSNRYATLVDSTYRVGRERAMIENRIKYEIYEQDKRIQENERNLQTSRLRIWFLSVSLIVLGCFAFIIFLSYRRKKRLYRAIVMQNSEYIAREQMLLEKIEQANAITAQCNKAGNTLSEEKVDDILSRFTLLMTEEKLFRDPSLTVGAVADRLGSNRTYVSRALNDTGKTFIQIINDYRIREAITMMSDFDANIPLKQICGDVGFSSISTFYSTFQNVTGMTPARYRAQLKEMKK